MAVETTTFSNNSADTWFRDIMFDCVLCPRACHVNRLAGQTGYCGQTAPSAVLQRRRTVS